MRTLTFALALLGLGCGAALVDMPHVGSAPLPSRDGEGHLAKLRRLTFGGENAEAYWSFDGRELVFQAHGAEGGCDRIWRFAPGDGAPEPVSSGLGATTCAYFLPGDEELIYASTHLGGPACPPRPDHSQGYVWALYDSYDIFKAKKDGSGVTRLTDTPGYDAEATVCARDGSIVFTSVRDGDIDLYRMDRDGRNVKRLTSTPGYDGGAYFNADCTKLVWRASRPTGQELDDFKALLARGLVRPGKLELWTANADGSEPTQVTWLGAASFGPSWHPSGRKIVFSSNVGDPAGHEFDLFTIDADGSHLERITTAPGFDGFPMFSPDGRSLVFASNRETTSGHWDTDLYLARWVEDAPSAAPVTAADCIAADIRWLADPARQGRGLDTDGLVEARDYLVQRFAALGLVPSGDTADTFTQRFMVVTRVAERQPTSLTLDKAVVSPEGVVPLAFSANATVKAPLVFAGYGIEAKDLGMDDWAGLPVKGRIAVVRRFAPEGLSKDAERKHGDLRRKAWLAREHGAKGLIVIDVPARPKDAPPDWKLPDEAASPALVPDRSGDAGIPAVVLRRAAAGDLLDRLARGGKVTASLEVALTETQGEAHNVIGRIAAGAPDKLPGVIVIGAHYDHLGLGGHGSLAPDKHEPHVGADDNASGTATLLEVARTLVEHRATLRRDVVIVAFSAEEMGLLGSTHLTRNPPAGLAMKDVAAMLNLDMVGRLREDKLTVLGGDSAAEWAALVAPACTAAGLVCTTSGDGFGPSDQTPFFAAGIPVLHFFTGSHSDYHTPGDTADKVSAGGAAQVAAVVAAVAQTLPEKLTYRAAAPPASGGDTRSFKASLGTIPDYAGPPSGQKGVLLAGVRAGGAADKAGLRRGDLLVKFGDHAVGSIEDFMYALTAAHPGDVIPLVIVREGKELTVSATLQEAGKH